MIRWLIVAAVLVWAGGIPDPVQAGTTDQLYQVQRAAAGQTALPGIAVPGLGGVRRLTSTSEQSQLTFSERQSLQPNVQYRSLFTPNDQHFSLQWNLQAMHVPAAWDVDQTLPIHGGDARIIVAVLDSGLASTLLGGAQSVPDVLPGTIWTNTGEVAGDGIDNDGDTYIDDIHGWNFVSNTARPADDNGHGTHISGVIAAATDNSLATAGIASNVTIMPLKVLDQAGLGSTATLTAAITYATQHGASIINLSLGGDEDDPIFHQAIQTAVQQGIVVIAAAGNSGAATVTYPAQYAEVIGVGATNTDGTRASYSNYGSGLTLVAPGGDPNLDLNADGQPDAIPSQTCADATCTTFFTIYLSGTSQAASEVSAVAALLESCGAPAGNIRTLLTSSAIDLGVAGRDDVFGAGQVDAAGALTAAGCVVGGPTTVGTIVGTASRSSSLKLEANRPLPYTRPLFTWGAQAGASFDVTWKKGSTTLVKVRQAAAEYSPTVKDEGLYTVTVAAVNTLGQVSPTSAFTYRYQKPVLVVTAGSKVNLLTENLTTFRTFSSTIGSALQISAGWLDDTFLSRLLTAAYPRGTTVTLLDTKGKTTTRVQPFGRTFAGGITSTVLDINQDSARFVVATRTNGASIAWYSTAGKVVGRNQVFAKYDKGVNIAAGDTDGDGNDELIVAQAAGPEIRIYSAAQKRIAVFSPRGKKFTQGWSITAGDVDGDGRAEILATPNIAVKTAKVLVFNGAGQELRSFTVTGSTAGPVLLQAIDLTGDGKTEVVTAPQRGAGSLQVVSASGKVLKQIKLPTTTFRSLSGL